MTTHEEPTRSIPFDMGGAPHMVDVWDEPPRRLYSVRPAWATPRKTWSDTVENLTTSARGLRCDAREAIEHAALYEAAARALAAADDEGP